MVTLGARFPRALYREAAVGCDVSHVPNVAQFVRRLVDGIRETEPDGQDNIGHQEGTQREALDFPL
jgi:hypothetical protein